MKNVLWLCNNPTPDASAAFGWDIFAVGGWVVWLSKKMGQSKEYHLCLAFPSKNVKEVSKRDKEGISYYAIPNTVKNNWTYDSKYEDRFESLIDMVKPDVIHIWGTEYQHSLALVNACEKKGLLDNCIVSIQGLVSIYAKYYLGNLSDNEKQVRTLRDVIKRDTLRIQQRHFQERGKFEIECIKKVKHVIGRTDWDKALTLQINPNIVYHYNNENLRDSFYQNSWSIDRCMPHRIFVSQAQYPIKGLDVLLKALPEVIRCYPDTHVAIAGVKVVTDNIYKKTAYDEILSSYIDRNALGEHVEFIGMCDEKQMVQEFLKANVFVCPSAIENSPNSVGEAMILGTPVVASNVGGTNCLLEHNEEGFLYQADADYMLAFYIKRLFASKDLALTFSEAARIHASKTHNRETNYKVLLGIYDEIENNDKRERT